MAKSKMKRGGADMGGYRMSSNSDMKIKNDYSAHANIPQNVIIEDISHDYGPSMPEYEDTMGAMDRQEMHDRKKTASSRPKSRY